MTFSNQITQRISIFNEILNDKIDSIQQIADLIVETIANGGKVLTAGNGGSAANAQHITGDIVGRYKLERRAYPSITLTVDPSLVTAIANDYGYEQLFARQIDGLGNKGDLLIVTSSSAHSPNILEGVQKAKEKGLTTLGVLGNNGGILKNELDYSLLFDFKDSDLVEEMTMAIFHMALIDVEERLKRMDDENEN
ncbi:D-sedoheptulose-7-phosphate isomerase [Allofustis seminis]|uniref:D-sedoheptulose-7-phosphate isomerase n=1 Tax=Allofustis seminis TaxID=166939 RepID=UPI0003667402|nr:SIS domain-containing protein [Allofustis seminis]